MATGVYELGAYVASEASQLLIPRGYDRDGSKMGLIYVHGAGERANTPINAGGNKTNEALLIEALADVYPLAMADLGTWGAVDATTTNAWGNTNVQTRIGQLITYLQQIPTLANGMKGGGAKPGPVGMFAISMGKPGMFNYAKNNPANVACMASGLGVSDLDDIRNNDRGGGPSSSYDNLLGTATLTTTGTTTVITLGSAVDVGGEVAVAITFRTVAGAVTAVDSKGNTYGIATNGDQAGAANIRTVVLHAYVSTAMVVGNTITITHPSTAKRVAIAVAFSGNPVPSPTTDYTQLIDASGKATGSSTTPSASATATGGTVDLVLAALGTNGTTGSVVTDPGGWTFIGKAATTGSSSVYLRLAYKVATGAGAVTYNPTLGSSIEWTDVVVALKKASGFRAGIDQAWGVTYPAALPAGANPATSFAGAVGIPSLDYYSTGDTVIMPATVTALAANLGASASAVAMSSLDHSDAAIGAIPTSDLLAFYRAHEV